MIRSPRLCQDLVDLFLLRVDLHLHLVENPAKILMKPRMHDGANMLEPESLVKSGLAHPYPRNIPLTDVHHTLGIIDQMVDLPLQNRLEILLHLPSGHLSDHREGELRTFRDLVQIRTDHLDLPILHLVHPLGSNPLAHRRHAAPGLRVQIVLTHPLSLERRPVRHGDRHLGHRHLQPSDFHRPRHDRIVRHIGHHVFIRTNPRRKHLRDRCIRNRREPPVDRPGRIRIPLLIHGSQRHHERKDPILTVNQNLPEIPGLHPSERHRRPRGESHRKHRRRRIRPERNQPRGPADLHARLDQLLREPLALVLPAHKHVQILLLQLLRDLRGHLRTRRRPHNRREPRRGPIHELDPPLP